MDSAPSPAQTIVVQVAAAPATFWDVALPWVWAGVLLAAALVWLVLLRRWDAEDRRSQWWRRAEWATDAFASDSPGRRSMASRFLRALGKSRAAGPAERTFIEAALSREPRPRRARR